MNTNSSVWLDTKAVFVKGVRDFNPSHIMASNEVQKTDTGSRLFLMNASFMTTTAYFLSESYNASDQKYDKYSTGLAKAHRLQPTCHAVSILSDISNRLKSFQPHPEMTDR